MKRIKSIDTFRGFCIFMMLFIHFNEWWLNDEDYLFFTVLDFVFAHSVGLGFVFVSGIATALSFQSRLVKAESSDIFNLQSVQNENKFRALMLLGLSFNYNAGIVLISNILKIDRFKVLNLADLWTWNILQTIAITLFLVAPFLKMSKTFRIIIGVILLFASQFILALLLPYQGQNNLYGVLFHLLFNPLDQYIFLPFFSVFLIGTVVGDIIFDISKIENENERKIALKKSFVVPLLIVGIILIMFGILIHNSKIFPISSKGVLLRVGSLPLMIYAIGINFIAISVLFYIEEFLVIKTKKKYRFFYFYSYYSFTIYYHQFILLFLFPDGLNIYNTLIIEGVTLFLITLLIIVLYKKVGSHASIKSQIGLIAFKIANYINKRKKLNNQNTGKSPR